MLWIIFLTCKSIHLCNRRKIDFFLFQKISRKMGPKVNVPVIVILLLKFDKILKNNFNSSILQQLIVRLNSIVYKQLS